MANSFMSKVAAERRVLAIVNARFRGTEQLAGLSRSAIDQWQRTVDDLATEQIVEMLIVLAELCQSLSDRSHESFKSLDPAVEEALDAALIALNAAICQHQDER